MPRDDSANKQHPVMRRVYEAAIQAGKISKETPLTDLANKMNESPQRVKNWDKRGPSSEGLLMIQLVTGVNATWALTGEGPTLVGQPSVKVKGPRNSEAAPADQVDFTAREVSDSEWALLEDLRVYPEDELAALREKVAKNRQNVEAVIAKRRAAALGDSTHAAKRKKAGA